MIPKQAIPRYLAMLWMFARHYAERLAGKVYPASIDSVPALLTKYEKQTLYRLAQQVPNHGVIVEIGSFKGGSTICFAAGASAKGVTIHCIDTFMAENVTGNEGQDTYAAFLHNTAIYRDMITVHRGYSYDMHGEFSEQIDLLFVDGDHSYEGVTSDLRLYVPRMHDNAILIMHDSAHLPIQQAIREFILPIEIKRLARLPNMYAGLICTTNECYLGKK